MADNHPDQQSSFPRKKKFSISENTSFWAVLALLLASTIYVGSLIAISGYQGTVPYGYYVVRDISLVIFTILLTTFLTARMIEVRGKNELYEDAILQDVVANPAFYKSFSDPVKRTMLAKLEQELVFSNSADVQAMYGSIKRKLEKVVDGGYYFSSCRYRVKCVIQNDVITKQINRTIKLRSFQPSKTIQDFLVVNWAGTGDVEGCFSLEKVEDEFGKELPYRQEKGSPSRALESFCGGYSINRQYKLRQALRVFSDRDTTVSITYTTRVPLSDNIYTCSSSVPCRQFSVDVQLLDSPDYKLNAATFGFSDASHRSTTQLDDSGIRVEFNDWVFNKDGVCIAFASRTTKPEPQTEEKTAEAVNLSVGIGG